MKESLQQMPTKLSERERLQILYERHRHEYEKNLHLVYKKLRKLLMKTQINFNIKYRMKSFDSYFKKVLRYHQQGISPVVINDLIGLRIICPFLEDVELVESILREHFQVVEVENKGARKSVNEFSYDAIHLTVQLPEEWYNGFIPYSDRNCEFQLRTILQDAWAEVEHELIYKANFSLFNEPIKRKLASLNATLTLSDIIFQEIRDYQKEVKELREMCHTTMTEKIMLSEGGENENQEVKDILQKNAPNLTGSITRKSKIERLLFDALEEHSKQNFGKAIQIYTQVLRQRLKPTIRSIIYNHRGMAYFVRGDQEKAINDFTRALKFDAHNLRALNNRGLSYRMLKQYDRALEDLNHSLDIDPYQHEAYHMRALTYFDLMDYGKALADCDRALELAPDYLPAVHLKKLVINKLGF